MFDFTDAQLQRYSRNILLPEIGAEGQARISAGKVLVVGAGGLGSPAAMYLAAAGVGTLGIVDHDRVDLTNLQRQILHSTNDIGSLKAESAAATIRKLNPEVHVEPVAGHLRAANVLEVIGEYDFVIDGTDNFAAKFLLNDACIIANIPFAHGGVLGFTGQAITVLPGRSACFRCIFRQPPPPGSVATCSEAGILGSVAGMLGTIQATEALKYLTGAGTLLTNALFKFDALSMQFRTVPINRQEDCPVCGKKPTIMEPADMPGQDCRIG